LVPQDFPKHAAFLRGTALAAAHWTAMAIPLLGYFSTMVATLIALMMLLNNVLSSGLMERTHHRPYPYPVIAQAAAPDGKQAAAADQQTGLPEPVVADKASKPSQTVAVTPARLAAAQQPASDRSQRQRLAPSQSHNEDVAGRQQDREYSLAFGNVRDAQRQPGALFDPFGPRRF
jgi:hypothetical protein